MAIEWNEKFGTGNGQIDAQHRRHFDMQNNLKGQINSGETPSKMADVFDGLAAYVREHVRYKEDHMQDCAWSACTSKISGLGSLRSKLLRPCTRTLQNGYVAMFAELIER